MANKSRDKDVDRDSSDSKKHRKTAGGSSSSSVSERSERSESQPIKPKVDVYANVIKFEEEESKKRSACNDADLFLEICEKLKTIFAEIAVLKTQTSSKALDEIKTKRINGSFLFAQLKKLSRLDKVRLRAGRDALHKEKLTVDSNKLQLQNLLYEADHLRKEVQRCLQFKSQDEEIDLVDEEKFYEEAPTEISRPEQTRTDEHARRLARLEWELHQRKELDTMCKTLQTAKENVAREIESKTNRLQSLMPCLEHLLKSTRPLQDALELNVEKEWAVQKIARLLPRPLYVAYVNLSAYAEISDKLSGVRIVGDEEEAKELVNTAKIENDDSKAAEESDDAGDDDDDPENHSKKKHHHRRQLSTVTATAAAAAAAAEVNVFKPHPLSITFKLPAPVANGPSLSITLYYLPALRFVSVQTQLIDFDAKGIAARDVLDSMKILNCLMSIEPDENEVLHPKIKYMLHHLSLDTATFFMKLGENQLGKPYTWAQNMCGLNFITCSKASASSVSNNAITQEMIPSIIGKMYTRLKARFQLYRQVFELEQQIYGNGGAKNSATNTATTCILAQWSPITFAEYMERVLVTGRFVDENMVTANHLLYHAVLIRGSAKMECFVSVSPNFPNECPIWAIILGFNGHRLHPLNSNDIKEVEYWINSTETFKKTAGNVLTVQLKRAMCSLDIYLETETIRLSTAGAAATAPATAPTEIKSEKTFLKIFRGRTRSKPYKLIQNGSSVIYTQI